MTVTTDPMGAYQVFTSGSDDIRWVANNASVLALAARATDFDTLAMKVNEKAKALGVAGAAKDAAGAKAALTGMKATCKECHSKFR